MIQKNKDNIYIVCHYQLSYDIYINFHFKNDSYLKKKSK